MTSPNVGDDARGSFTLDVMQIQGTPVQTRLGMLPHSQLRFCPENPRVYSIVHEDGRAPGQEDIQARLQEMDHVKGLVHDIKKHGGLIDPLVVRDGSFEVVEGNSRLAAYRVLAQKNPDKWGYAKCRLLPRDVDERLVASLLSQWHLKGKKEWPPFEQAGYMHRRYHEQAITLAALASEAGLTQLRIEKIIEAYQLMIDQRDAKRDRWSYYDEFVKSRKIAKACAAQSGFRERVLGMIKHGEFDRAQDLRDKLPAICDAPPKIRTKFVVGKLTFDEAFEAAQDAGGDDAPYKKLRKFRLWLSEQEVQDHVKGLEGEIRDKAEFELRKLHGLLTAMLRKSQ
jgi:hypothetical protein